MAAKSPNKKKKGRSTNSPKKQTESSTPAAASTGPPSIAAPFPQLVVDSDSDHVLAAVSDYDFLLSPTNYKNEARSDVFEYRYEKASKIFLAAGNKISDYKRALYQLDYSFGQRTQFEDRHLAQVHAGCLSCLHRIASLQLGEKKLPVVPEVSAVSGTSSSDEEVVEADRNEDGNSTLTTMDCLKHARSLKKGLKAADEGEGEQGSVNRFFSDIDLLYADLLVEKGQAEDAIPVLQEILSKNPALAEARDLYETAREEVLEQRRKAKATWQGMFKTSTTASSTAASSTDGGSRASSSCSGSSSAASSSDYNAGSSSCSSASSADEEDAATSPSNAAKGGEIEMKPFRKAFAEDETEGVGVSAKGGTTSKITSTAAATQQSKPPSALERAWSAANPVTPEDEDEYFLDKIRGNIPEMSLWRGFLEDIYTIFGEICSRRKGE